MNLTFASVVLVCMGSVSAAISPTEATFRPYRVDFADLTDDDSFLGVKTSFMDALSQVGMVSVTNIPFASKYETFLNLHRCSHESAATLKHTFNDGTIRHTMATHTVPGGMQKISHATMACDGFSKASDELRQTVADVTEAFSFRLNSILELEDKSTPLLATIQNYPFKSLVHVVESGEHLEHFHSYQRTSFDTTENTIDIHVDQGLFIAFTPALLVSAQDDTEHSNKGVLSVSDGFYIELQDGSRATVEFDATDDLVFMLGDGVNQFINPRLSKESARLRAAPHALTMPYHDVDEARVWYGRMVLPPSDAIHPEHGVTFDEIRQGLMEGRGDTQLDLGCSANTAARKLQETECTGNSIYCWHQCMDATEYSVSDEICAAQGLDLRCINPRNQLYVDGHGDFYPACIDASTASNVTDYPPLEGAPRNEDKCTLAAYNTFASNTWYENQLVMGDDTGTFSWTFVDGVLNGRLAFNGLFGWLAFGMANPTGILNGMLGASIIMALPGGNYNAADGLDLTVGSNVNEYHIDPFKTAFRHWSTPVTSETRSVSTKQYAVEVNDCFTAITFKTDNINNIKFNVTGSDELLWAANGADYYAGYHGANRFRFAIDWTTSNAVDSYGNALLVTKMTPVTKPTKKPVKKGAKKPKKKKVSNGTKQKLTKDATK
ncbi:hypothetical protein MHU86_25675 [Fragilaria crotonensis]|nr:hypothetical protein MHU86_25675 [Fragilaria crotonensis]